MKRFILLVAFAFALCLPAAFLAETLSSTFSRNPKKSRFWEGLPAAVSP